MTGLLPCFPRSLVRTAPSVPGRRLSAANPRAGVVSPFRLRCIDGVVRSIRCTRTPSVCAAHQGSAIVPECGSVIGRDSTVLRHTGSQRARPRCPSAAIDGLRLVHRAGCGGVASRPLGCGVLREAPHTAASQASGPRGVRASFRLRVATPGPAAIGLHAGSLPALRVYFPRWLRKLRQSGWMLAVVPGDARDKTACAPAAPMSTAPCSWFDRCPRDTVVIAGRTRDASLVLGCIDGQFRDKYLGV